MASDITTISSTGKIAVDDYINIRGLGKCAIESRRFGWYHNSGKTMLEVRQVQSGKYYLVSDLAVLSRWPDTIYSGGIITGG